MFQFNSAPVMSLKCSIAPLNIQAPYKADEIAFWLQILRTPSKTPSVEAAQKTIWSLLHAFSEHYTDFKLCQV